MKKYGVYFLLLVMVVGLTGCDTAETVWSAITEFFGSYLSDFTCYVYSDIIQPALQSCLDAFCYVADNLVLLLPEVELPSIDVSSFEWLSYAAFFIPIGEMAGVLKAFIGLAGSFWLIRVVLSWLKIWT